MPGVNVSRIQSVYAPHATRRHQGSVDRCDRPRYGDDRVVISTGSDGDAYDAYCPSNIESPIMPPWRVLPWPHAAGPVTHRPAAAVKAAASTADLNGVGRTLDLFV